MPKQLLCPKNYPLAENISIDYALMEKSEDILMLPARFDWDDLGSWKIYL